MSRAVPFTSTIYPIDVWVPRGVLVLEPNYRGSAGYGEKFRALNVRNLGVGDAWDALGRRCARREGAGRSGEGRHQAGARAAISPRSWPPTTPRGSGDLGRRGHLRLDDLLRQHRHSPLHAPGFKATPWDDPEIYAKTSPITYIKQAKTPTLIQHGAADQRVPLPNAYELYQGLQDNKVPTRLIVYQGFGGIGHGPSKPKSHRATMEHNLEWFDQYSSRRPRSRRAPRNECSLESDGASLGQQIDAWRRGEVDRLIPALTASRSRRPTGAVHEIRDLVGEILAVRQPRDRDA